MFHLADVNRLEGEIVRFWGLRPDTADGTALLGGRILGALDVILDRFGFRLDGRTCFFESLCIAIHGLVGRFCLRISVSIHGKVLIFSR